MTPAQLDILLNGAFIYEGADGKQFASLDYKLRDYGMKFVGRAGPLADDDLAGGTEAYLQRVTQRIAA